MLRNQFEELKHTGNLPSPTGLGMKILVLTRNEDCSLEDIVKAIQSDPALTGRIIKLATSVQLGNVSGTITSPREAAIRLGLRTVSNVALGFTLISGNRTGRCTAFDYDHYWAWSLANAIAAQVICADPGRAVPSAEAFTCGLLARIGQLALASVHADEYAAVLSRAAADPTVALATLEQDAFHIDHDQVTSAMLSDWGLPPVFSEAVLLVAGAASEGEAEGPEVRHLGQILEAAAVLADICLESESGQHLHWQKLQETRARLGLSAADFQLLFQSIVKEWEEWGRFLRLPTNRVLSIPEIQRRAHSQAKDTEAATVPDAAEGGLRILAVDDDPTSLRLLVLHLTRAGHRVTTATNGEEALAVALESNPQIVVTDWMMPGMDGIELCKRLRSTPFGRGLYVLILTGRTEEDRIVEAFEAGVDDYIVKPFKPKLLLARIRGGQRIVRLQQQVERDKRTQQEQVDKLALLTRRLHRAAMTDPLTEIHNRRYAMRRLDIEWANSTRSSMPLSVIMIDIDEFKKVNDSWGHDVGDRTLVATAGIIRSSLRRGDTCARIGGEEFLVICPNTDAAGARRVAQRICDDMKAARFDYVRDGVTASLGAATTGPHLTSIDALLKAADEAVYAAKRAGRSRVVQAPRPEERAA